MAGTTISRIQAIKNRLLEITPGICTERALLVTEAYQRTEGYPAILRRAEALSNVLRNMTIYIDAQELIVGNQASRPRSAPVFPEYSWRWILEELDSFEHRPSDRFEIDQAKKRELREVLQYWKMKTVQDRAEALQPELVKKATSIGVMEWEGNVTSGEGHLTVDFPSVLEFGLQGILERAREARSALDMTKPEALRKAWFYEAVEKVLEAAISFCQRYAILANDKAGQAAGQRREELNRIAETCAWVSTNSPRNFWEALQLVWFVQLILQIESNGHSVSLGRMDQYLYKYYSADVDEGRFTDDQIKELIEAFFLKLFSINKLRPWSHTQFLSGYPTFQNVCVGGQDASGKDATNRLSYLFVEALADVRLPEPNFYVRYHRGTPRSFMMRCLETIRLGFGMPAFVNDEVVIPSLVRRGVALEDARNYATVGCLEVSVPGKWGYRCNGKSKLNLPKILELALHGGRDPSTGVTLRPCKLSFQDFDEVMQAWADQLRYYTDLHVIADNINSLAMEELAPDPFCSALVQDCLGRGLCLSEGGAVYDIQSGAQIGVPNVGNSLAAVKKVVFEDRLMSMDELRRHLREDFSGQGGREARELLMRAPKYGNDDDYVDLLTKEAYDYYCYAIEEYHNTRYGRGPLGGGWMPSTVTISSNVPAGKAVGATPDGRRKGEPLVDGVSPMHGTERLGITAVLKSVTKLSTVLMTGGQLLNLRILGSVLDDSEGMEKFLDLLRTFFELKGWHVQVNTIKSEVLRDAQLHPENYRDLVVRVAGYSALFVSLDRSVQDDIISRMEHVV